MGFALYSEISHNPCSVHCIHLVLVSFVNCTHIDIHVCTYAGTPFCMVVQSVSINRPWYSF